MQHYHNLHQLLTYSRAMCIHRLDFARCRTIALLHRNHEIQGLLVRVKSTIRERVQRDLLHINIRPIEFCNLLIITTSSFLSTPSKTLRD